MPPIARRYPTTCASCSRPVAGEPPRLPARRRAGRPRARRPGAAVRLRHARRPSRPPSSCVSTDLSASQKTLHFSNWPLYIDEKKVKRAARRSRSTRPSRSFEKQTRHQGRLRHRRQRQLRVLRRSCATSSPTCKPTGRDIMTLTDWMAARMVDLGWLQKLDKSKMPNVDANLVEHAASRPSWDKNRDYSRAVAERPDRHRLQRQAHQGGRAASTSCSTRPDLKGKVSLLSEMHDTMLFMLLLEGADPEDFTADEFGKAIERLQKADRRRPDPGVHRQRVRPGPRQGQHRGLRGLVRRHHPAAVRQPGHQVRRAGGGPGALERQHAGARTRRTHKANAEKLMDYYYDPEVAATLAAWVNYICPVEGAKQAMEKIDTSLVDNELIFPTRGDAGQGQGLHGAGPEDRAEVPEAVRRGDRSLTRWPTDDGDRRRRRQDAGADLTLTLGDQEVRRLHGGRRPRPASSSRAGSSRCSARRAAARPRRCGWSRASRSRPAGTITHRRPGHQPAQALQAPGQHGLPELRAVPAPRHLRERRVRAAPPRRQGRQEAGRARCSSWSSSAATASAARPSSPAASSSGSRWPGR